MAPLPPGLVIPVPVCIQYVKKTGATEYDMYTYFSYTNVNDSIIDLTEEAENRFVVSGVLTAYPLWTALRTTFYPGSHDIAFQITSPNSTSVSWTLNGQTVQMQSSNLTARCDTSFAYMQLSILFQGTYVSTMPDTIITNVFLTGGMPIARQRITGSGRQVSTSKRAPTFELTFLIAPSATQPDVTAHSLASYFYTQSKLPAYTNNLGSAISSTFLSLTNRTVFLDYITPNNDVPYYDGPLGSNVPPPEIFTPYTPPPPDYYTNPVYAPSRGPSQPVTPGSTGTNGTGPAAPTQNVLLAPNSLGLAYIWLIVIIAGALVLAIILFFICCCCCTSKKPKRPTLRQQLAEEKARQETMKQDYWEAMYSTNGGQSVAVGAAAGGAGTVSRQRRRNRMMDELDDTSQSDSYEELAPPQGTMPMVSMTAAPDDVPIAGGPGGQGGYGTNRFGTQRRQRPAVAAAPAPPPYQASSASDKTDSYESVDEDEDYEEDTDSE